MESSMIKGRDFIFFGLQPWDIPIGSNCKNIAMEVAKHNRVLYVNRPLDRVSSITKKSNPQTQNRIRSIKTGENTLVKEAENLWVFNPRVMMESVNVLPKGFIYNYLSRRNSKKLAAEIEAMSSQLKLKDPILFIDNDFFYGLHLKDFLKPSLFIYYIRDFLLSQQYFIRHGTAAEQMMIKKADAIAANSKYLASYGSKFNANARDIGQGCDVEDFLLQPASKPADIAHIKSPIIGYCGSLTATRLDISLISFIASQRPQWNIVLVGPEDENFKKAELHQLENVFFTGSKPASDLPAYVHSFDVCINPQVLNQMTIGNYPRKVDEYLAAGKPVVATKTEAMDMFLPLVYLCSSPEEYISMIEKALSEAHDQSKAEERIHMATGHTWAASVAKLYNLITDTINRSDYE